MKDKAKLIKIRVMLINYSLYQGLIDPITRHIDILFHLSFKFYLENDINVD